MAEWAYLETSVVSYLTARPSRDVVVAGHQQSTHEWWEKQSGDYELCISQLVLAVAKVSMNDPILEEIWRIRDAHAAKFNYDPDAIFQDIKEQERKSGYVFVDGVARDGVTSQALEVARGAYSELPDQQPVGTVPATELSR